MRTFRYQPQHLKPQPTLRSRAIVPVAAFALVAGLGTSIAAVPQVALAAETTTTTQQSGDVTETVRAYNEDQTVNGNVTVVDDSDEEYPPGAYGVENSEHDVTIKGDVTAESKNGYASGVTSYADSSTTVEGDVSTKGKDAEGVTGQSGASVDVGGNVSAEAESSANGVITHGEDTTVSVGGDVSATSDYATGVSASESSSVDIKGDVTATGEDSAYGVIAYSNDTAVTVGGSVTAEASGEDGTGTGAFLYGGSTVVVKGDLTGSTTGAVLRWNAHTKDLDTPTLAVSGTVTGSESAIDIYYDPYYYDDDTQQWLRLDDEDLPTPEILVGALKVTNSDGTLVRVFVEDSDAEPIENKELEAAILKEVNYIVNAGDGVTVTGTETKTIKVNGDDYTYQVAHSGDTLTITDATGTHTVKVVDGGSEDGTPLTFENAAKPASVAAKHLASEIPQTGDATTSSFAVAMAVAGGVAVLGGAHFARRRED